MARETVAPDELSNERKSDRSLLDRRSYLRLAGATAATIAGASAAASAQEDSYDTITVSAGDTHRIDLGDGETFENTIIDITAKGANVNIRAHARNWTMRNVAIKGSTPAKPRASSPMMVCSDPGGDSVIENCWFGDGSGGATWREAVAGVFVHAKHAGTLTIRDCYFKGWLNNAVYASPPGNPNTDYYRPSSVGQGGDVYVEDSYFEANDVASIRLGGEGSYAKNCVVNGGNHRGCWAYYEHIDFINVDSTAARAFEAGGGAHDYMASAVAEVQNCRADGAVRARGGAEIRGQTEPNPSTSPPDSVPLSAKEAASGQTDSSSSDSTTTTEKEDDQQTGDQQGTLFELVADPNAANLPYEFTVEGTVTKNTAAGDNSAENNDSITDNGDGTVTVSGVSGNGYGDAFHVDGVVTAIDLDEDAWTLRFGGDEVVADDLILPNKLVIDGSNAPRTVSNYKFEVSGTARKSAEHGSINAHDTVSDGTISGRTIGGKDGYRFSGQINGFSLDGPANVRIEENR